MTNQIATKAEARRRFRVEVVDELPDGWRVVDGLTQPRGYVWVLNGESIFSGRCRYALMMVR